MEKNRLRQIVLSSRSKPLTQVLDEKECEAEGQSVPSEGQCSRLRERGLSLSQAGTSLSEPAAAVNYHGQFSSAQLSSAQFSSAQLSSDQLSSALPGLFLFLFVLQ